MNALENRDGRALYSYDYLCRRIDALIADGSSFSIILFDLDFFHNLDRRLGQSVGDAVMQGIAEMLGRDERIQAARRESDEFLLLAEGARLEEAARIAETCRRRFRQARWIPTVGYERVPIRASFGVVARSACLDSRFLLLKAAETALLTAKKKGRNRVETAQDKPVRIFQEGCCRTLVGYSLRGRCEDGVLAYTASIAEPYGVDLDGQGRLLFVDRSNHQIKYIERERVYTLAGTGHGGYSGDGDNPLLARFSKPSGVAVHRPTGRVYVADTGNHCIRLLEKGTVRTLAGDGEEGYSGDDGAGPVRFSRPGGVAVDDNGYLYTNDYGNNVIRRIAPDGTVSTVAGNGSYGPEGDGGPAIQAQLDRPYGLCVTPNGRWLFIADCGNHSIRWVDLPSGSISTLCGTGEPGYSGDSGPAVQAQLDSPYWVTIDADRFLFIADAGNHCIRLVDLQDGSIRTVAGNPEPGYVDTRDFLLAARFNIPAGLAYQDNRLYVADYGNNALRELFWRRPVC